MGYLNSCTNDVHKREVIVDSEERICSLRESISQPTKVCFHIAQRCRESFYIKEEKCDIPCGVLIDALKDDLKTISEWCKKQHCAGQNFKLKINLENPFKWWYAEQQQICVCDVVDVKGGVILLTNVSNPEQKVLHKQDIFETAKFWWHMRKTNLLASIQVSGNRKLPPNNRAS